MSEDAKTLIDRAVRTFLDEVPALAPLKLVVGIELHGRGDIQLFRVEMPGLEVRKDIAADAKVRLEMRARVLQRDGRARRAASPTGARRSVHGHAKATGPSRS